MTKFLCGECIHNSDKGGGCLIPKNLGYVDNCNYYLPKDRPIVQTNEEWFCTLPTEVKATFLAIQVRLGVEFYRTNDERYQNHDWWVEWLKQPYHEKE